MVAYHELRKAILKVERRPNHLAGAVITPEKLAGLRSSLYLERLLEEIRAEAEIGASQPLPALNFADFKTFRETGTRFEYERPYFHRRGRLLALAMALLIDEDDKYLEPLEQTIWEICGEYSWAVPAHLPYSHRGARDSLPSDRIVDLFAAETGHALAEMLLLVGDRLHPWVSQRVRLEVERRVFEPTFGSGQPFFWFSAEHNWSAVCAGAVGMAALLLVEDRERLAGMQARIADAMESFLSGYGEDGCCLEGAGYWTYGFGYYVYWAEMLYDYTDREVDLLEDDKIRRIADYAGSTALSSMTCINYSDCSPSLLLHPGMLTRLRSRIGASVPALPRPPLFHDDRCYRWPHLVRNLLWTDEDSAEGELRMGTIDFPDAGWIIDKRDTPSGLFAFSAKGGHNGEPHNHNDLGHFIVHIGGETLLTDLGPGMYTKDYFGAGRYSYLHTSSRGHSVPVINGCGQQAGEEYAANVLRSVRDGDHLHFDLDLTGAYGPETELELFTRHFLWTCREGEASAKLEVRDVFEFISDGEQPEQAGMEAQRPGNRVTEHLISLNRPEMGPGSVIWRGERAKAELVYDSSKFEAAVEEIASITQLGEVQKVYRTVLMAEGLKDRFVGEWSLCCRVE
ncbi:heparinase II/III family protein [Saccharibacillus deserti]|uniref:heparinase II/III family protein n=1 Tax=Saccharibacillus deserti TaxID=1634444 RepID=UPI001554578E|nr:heparinase II/III family protein [Saccharibacillus deserti]